MPSQKKVTWNEFRALHKGVSTNKLSQMWTDYKVGAYSIPDDTKSVAEEVVEEKAAKMEAAVVAVKDAPSAPQDIDDFVTEYKKLSNRITRFGKSMKPDVLSESNRRLKELAELTSPRNYKCLNTDGWKLWSGPTQACILVNETRKVAFLCSRSWWNANWQGAKYVSYETVGEGSVLDGIHNQYKRTNRLVRRPPLEGVEIMLPRTARDTMLRGN